MPRPSVRRHLRSKCNVRAKGPSVNELAARRLVRYPARDSNPHGLTARYFAGTCVYQFRQPGRVAPRRSLPCASCVSRTTSRADDSVRRAPMRHRLCAGRTIRARAKTLLLRSTLNTTVLNLFSTMCGRMCGDLRVSGNTCRFGNSLWRFGRTNARCGTPGYRRDCRNCRRHAPDWRRECTDWWRDARGCRCASTNC